MMKPLNGIRILDFTQYLAGPLCTMLLADLGAEVIKLENPPLGDQTRYTVTLEGDKSTNFTSRNRGKKSVIMDLKDPRQKALFLELIKTADAVVENFKPGTLEKYGITYELLKERNPRIVYTSISGYGQYGPYRDHAAYDGAIQAEGGLISVTGERGGEGVRCGVSIADSTAGLTGCIGTLSALLDAQRTGVGHRVDVAMMDSVVMLLENLVSSYLVSGTLPLPMGNGQPFAYPICDFVCRDGEKVFVAISTDSQFRKFSEMLGHGEWAEDPRFSTMALRVLHAEELEPLIAAAMLTVDSSEITREMQQRKLVYGSINNIAQVVAHPQLAARKMLVDAVYPDGDTFRVPGCPIKMSGLEQPDRCSAAPLGYHTFEVLSAYADRSELHKIYDPVLERCAQEACKKCHPEQPPVSDNP